MSATYWTSLLALLLLAPANGTAADAPRDAASLPAWPAALQEDCDGNCDSTLTQPHELMFVSRVAFPVGSALLSGDAKAELLRMLAELESFAVVSRVEVIGHADPSGPENFNIWLSKRRAERVGDFFLQSGVDPRMMSFSGAGSSDPLPGAIDPSEHRRTEVRITVRPFL